MAPQTPLNIHILENIDSTNNWIKKYHTQFDLTQCNLLVAKEQSQGRGSYGKNWFSPKDVGVYASLFYIPSENFPLDGLAQLVSLSLADTLTTLGFAPKIKWPNDLFLEEAKVGGVLCEMLPLVDKKLIIIGFGINVITPLHLCNQLDQPATSLMLISGEHYHVYHLALMFAENLQKKLAYPFSNFTAEYNAYMTYRNHPVFLKEECLGRSLAVNSQGQLEIITHTHQIRAITHGSIKIQSPPCLR